MQFKLLRHLSILDLAKRYGCLLQDMLVLFCGELCARGPGPFWHSTTNDSATYLPYLMVQLAATTRDSSERPDARSQAFYQALAWALARLMTWRLG